MTRLAAFFAGLAFKVLSAHEIPASDIQDPPDGLVHPTSCQDDDRWAVRTAACMPKCDRGLTGTAWLATGTGDGDQEESTKDADVWSAPSPPDESGEKSLADPQMLLFWQSLLPAFRLQQLCEGSLPLVFLWNKYKYISSSYPVWHSAFSPI